MGKQAYDLLAIIGGHWEKVGAEGSKQKQGRDYFWVGILRGLVRCKGHPAPRGLAGAGGGLDMCVCSGGVMGFLHDVRQTDRNLICGLFDGPAAPEE